jgi:hypothetical protein
MARSANFRTRGGGTSCQAERAGAALTAQSPGGEAEAESPSSDACGEPLGDGEPLGEGEPPGDEEPLGDAEGSADSSSPGTSSGEEWKCTSGTLGWSGVASSTATMPNPAPTAKPAATTLVSAAARSLCMAEANLSSSVPWWPKEP